MSASRRDLFVSITLPLMGLATAMFGVCAGAYVYTYNVSQNASDDAQQVRSEAQRDRDNLNVRLDDLRKSVEAGQKSADDKLNNVIAQLAQMNANLAVIGSKIDRETR